MLRTGLAGGPLSQETYCEETGHDVVLERARKATEATLDKKILEPAFDAAHGTPERAGRKLGSPDQPK
jgi:hypothetical protein